MYRDKWSGTFSSVVYPCLDDEAISQCWSTFVNRVSMFEQEGGSNNVIMDVQATDIK